VSPQPRRPSREDVLDAFAVEVEPGCPTLERYLRLYPEFAGELVELSRELSRERPDDTAALSPADQTLIDTSWSRHAAARPTALVDPFLALTVEDWRGVARRLDLPRQVVTALRERRVLFASIPRRFLAQFAEAVRSSVAQVEASWGITQIAGARSYKAEGKPGAGEPISFEQVLIEAAVPPEKRARLLSEVD
jgi:hypothetical protein